MTLEDSIMSCWQVTEDIETVYRNIEDLDTDELASTLLGLRILYNLRFSELFEEFSKTLRERSQI